jgi:hypothetical protein
METGSLGVYFLLYFRLVCLLACKACLDSYGFQLQYLALACVDATSPHSPRRTEFKLAPKPAGSKAWRAISEWEHFLIE